MSFDALQDSEKSLKPEILKAWKLKLLVLLLCTISFYAGWQASRSYLTKECLAEGGQVSFRGSLVLCRLSPL